MPNPFDQFDAGPAPAANPFDQFDTNAAAPSTSPTPGGAVDWIEDKAKRMAQGAIAGTGDILAYGGHLAQEANAGMRRLGAAIGASGPAYDDELAADTSGDAAPQALGAAGQAVGSAAAAIKPNPARDKDLSSTLASMAGTLLPVGAAALAGGIPAAALSNAGIGSEETRKRALAAGDSWELADAKAKVAAVPGALVAMVPGGSGYGSTIAGSLIKRAAIDATVNAGAEVASERLVDDKVNWGQVGLAGAYGAGLGVVLGIPEAIAMKRAFGAAGANVEGKTLGEAVDQVSKATGQDPTDVQRQINQAAGLRPAGDNDVGEAIEEGAAPTEAETAVRRAQAEDAFSTLPPAANIEAGDAAQKATVLEANAARTKAYDDLLTTRDQNTAEDLQGTLQQNQLGTGESIQLGEDPAQNRLTVLDTRPGNSVRERARIQAQIEARRIPIDEGDISDSTQLSAQAAAVLQRDQNGGFIDPKILVPFARVAIGGTYGYATGKDPEDRVVRALGFAGLGAIASPTLARWLTNQVLKAPVASDVADWAGAQFNALRLKLAPQSFLPSDIAAQLHWGEQAVTAISRQGQALALDLQTTIRSVGDLAAQGAAARDAQDFLTGNIPLQQLQPPVQPAAAKVRAFIDNLSDQAVATGVVNGTMAQTFLTNKGSYLRRSYEIFVDPNFKPAQPKIDAAVSAVATANKMSTPEARVYVNDLLAKHNRAGLSDFMLGQGKIAGKDVGSLVQRQNLLPEIRSLFGEIKDPVTNVTQTVPRLAKLIEMDATQKNIRGLGLGSGLFRDSAGMKQIPPDQVGKWIPLVSDSNRPHDNFQGLWARPEIAAAFQKRAGDGTLAGVPDLLWKAWSTAVFAAKSAKTVFNPASYAVNFAGHAMLNIAQGNFRYDFAGRGLMLGAEELGLLRRFQSTSPTRDALRAEIQQLTRLGVFHESPIGEDLERTLQNSFWRRIGGSGTNVLRFPGEVYNQMFNFNRYVGYRSELARYAASYPNKPLPELQRLAADVVSATTPTYSKVPKFVKQLSVAGLTPSFINFPFEVFRNTFNSARIGRADLVEGLKSGNAALARNGARRLAGITLMLGAASGLGVAKLSRRQNNVSDQQDRAVRFFGAPWNRDGSLQYHGPIANGQTTFSNLEYILPHAIVTQAIDAAVRGADQGEAAQSFLRALASRFTGDNILAGPLAGAITGMDPDTKRPIPRTAVDPTFADRADYLWEKAFEPLVIPWAQKLNKAMQGQQGDYGQVYTVKDQLDQLVGVRAQSLDLNKAVDFKARDLGSQFNQATGLYRSKLKENLPPGDMAKAYENSEGQRKQVFGQLEQMVRYAAAAGVPDDTVIKAMRSAQIPSNAILGVLDGRYVAGDRTAKLTASEALQQILAQPAQARGAALAQVYQRDPTLGRAVVDQVKQVARGIGPRDQLLLSLGAGTGERAAYIQQKLAALPDASIRMAWLQDLARKRILTPEVMGQIGRPNPASN